MKGDDDVPVVVMRRVRGKTWCAYIRDPAWAESQGARDLLEQNLRVFIRVCEILEFVHAQHVVHRDPKPGNVMVGTFGEVYLLDWGLAVATGGEPAEHRPQAEHTREVCGTMSYAAREMVGLLDVAPSARTDVYLLGSILFETATGKPPHRKRDEIRTLESTRSRARHRRFLRTSRVPTFKRFLIGSLIQLPLVAVAWAVSPELRSTLFNRRMLGTAQRTLLATFAIVSITINVVLIRSTNN